MHERRARGVIPMHISRIVPLEINTKSLCAPDVDKGRVGYKRDAVSKYLVTACTKALNKKNVRERYEMDF